MKIRTVFKNMHALYFLRVAVSIIIKSGHVNVHSNHSLCKNAF